MMSKWIFLFFVTLGVALPASAQNDDLPEGAGKAMVKKMCSGCHKMTTVTSKHATKEQWATIVDRMVSHGANGTDEEIDIVVNYLAANFPPEKKDPPPPSFSISADWMALSGAQMEMVFCRWREYATRKVAYSGR